ncbi:MAG: hypothetical protein LBV07_01480 [Syntrophobacterales bacterium]|jgi:hypothetical protein|nr:hypothetical protein [Syntrophobacterales bacterium]
MKRLLFLITFLFASTAYTAEIYFSPGEGYTDAVLEQIYYAIAEDETRGQDYAEAHQDPVEEESACHILSHEKLVHRGTRESNDLKKLEMTNRFFNERMIYDENAWGD